MTLVSHPTLCERGAVAVPMRPGIGVEVDREALRRYRAT